MFGLIGVTGALVAPLAGRLADRVSAPLLNGGALLLVLLAFLLMGLVGTTLLGLALGVVLLDAGVQASHLSNQTRIYALHPDLRNRLNAVYMVTYFLGGAAGSALGGYALAARRMACSMCCRCRICGGGYVCIISGRARKPATALTDSMRML